MSPLEALALTRFVRAACPQQAMDEFTPDAWVLLLGDTTFAEAKDAAITVVRRQPFCAPAEILAEVRRARASRIGDGVVDDWVAGINPDDIPAYLAGLRAKLAALAEGGHPDTPPGPELARRPMGDLIAATARGIPTEEGPR